MINKDLLSAITLLTFVSIGLMLGVNYWSGFLTPGDFEIYVNPTYLETYNHQGPLTINITLRSTNDFNNTIHLFTENVPSAFTSTFTHSEATTCTISCPAQGEISTTLTLIQEEKSHIEGTPRYDIIISGVSKSSIQSKTVYLQILDLDECYKVIDQETASIFRGT